MNTSDDIVALSTPYAKSALAIVRVTGSQSYTKFNALCIPDELHSSKVKKVSYSCPQFTPRHIAVRTLVHPVKQCAIDTAVIIPYRAPKSYTGEDMMEIIIHGGIPAIDMLLDALISAQFRYAEAGEFSKRAFLNHKIDLVQAEAIQQIIEAPTMDVHMQSVKQMGGTLTNHILAIKTDIISLASKCAVSIDYPEEEIAETITLDPKHARTIITRLEQLLLSYDYTQQKKDGIAIAIVGQPNVGKSSLFNALCNEERAIVSKQAGTTRDYLDIVIQDNAVRIKLYDTAGLRVINQEIEQLGIERSYDIISKVDIVLYVIAADRGIEKKDEALIKRCLESNTHNANLLFVINKSDLVSPETLDACITNVADVLSPLSALHTPHTTKPTHTQEGKQVLSCSCLSQKSVNDVLNALFVSAHARLPLYQSPVIVQSLRQRNYFKQCLVAMQEVKKGIEENQPLDMISLDLDDALRSLGAVMGEINADEVLDAVFSTFCVGK